MPLDFKALEMGTDYDPAHPVKNWLRWKLSTGYTDCDQIALADELATVRAEGHKASPDSMHSFWTTYSQAICLKYGPEHAFYLGNSARRSLRTLLDRYEQYQEVNDLFADFAQLTHARGNFILVPVTLDDRNFNLRRARKPMRDYWDLALEGIKVGAFEEYFAGDQVAQRFQITEGTGGFGGWVERNHLEGYLDSAGEVSPLWPGHLDHGFGGGRDSQPQTIAEVEVFLETVTTAIRRRGRALGA